MKPTKIIIHTAAFRGEADINTVEQWHLARGFARVGYHWYIRRDGTTQAGRPEDIMGAHCKAGGMNRVSIGVCFEGHGDFQPLTPDQIYAWGHLYAQIRQRWGITPENVHGHNEFEPNKTCPGKLISVAKLRQF
jgi:N-acetylmuramoyl-L-alanine amidase